MKKILFAALLLLSLMVCMTSPAWAGGLEDAQAGATAFGEGNYDEAIRLSTKAIASGELAREQLKAAHVLRGFAWGKKGDSDKAIADFTKAIEIDPKYADAYTSRGNAWHKKGDLNKAIADYNKAIELDRRYPLAYYNRGIAWYDKGDSDKAIADFTKAIEIDPKYADAYTSRGSAWYKKGDLNKANADYNKAKELNPRLGQQ